MDDTSGKTNAPLGDEGSESEPNDVWLSILERDDVVSSAGLKDVSNIC